MLEQLSPQDASFVFMETPATPMHIGSMALYDASTTPAGEINERTILNYFGDRLSHWKNLRQRLVRVPFDADYPYWIEDRDFDLEYHIRRIGLPRPASFKELTRLAARIFSRPLDMSRPLWEIYVIDGLGALDGMSEGSFALLTKSHHAGVDGASGMHLMQLLHDLVANPEQPPRPAPLRPADPVPSDTELLGRTWVNNLRQPLRFARVLGQAAGMAREAVREINQADLPTPKMVPKTRFNGRVSSQRVMRWSVFTLAEISALRAPVPGASLNDVILTLCAGGLRHYLESKQELNRNSLIAMAPINIRKDDAKDAMGNQVSAMFVPIGTDIENPLERLAAVRKATRDSKALGSAVGARLLTDYGQFVPAASAALAARLMSRLAADGQPAFNLTITNVPGPQVPLYSMGARMTQMLGMGPLTQGMGLIMPITSYCGEIAIGFTSCRDMVPDPDFLQECIERSHKELEAAVRAQAELAQPATKAKPRAKAPPKTKAPPEAKAQPKAQPKEKTAATKRQSPTTGEVTP